MPGECPFPQTPFSAFRVMKGVVAPKFKSYALGMQGALGGSKSVPKVCPWLKPPAKFPMADVQRGLKGLIQVWDF